MSEAKLVCLLTGTNSSIGYASMIALVCNVWSVVMVCRDKQQGQNARNRIIHQTGNNNIHLRLADLASQQSLQSLIQTGFPTLKILSNNAGAIFNQCHMIVDALEKTFARKDIVYFILTSRLLQTLQDNLPVRISNIGSFVTKDDEVTTKQLVSVCYNIHLLLRKPCRELCAEL